MQRTSLAEALKLLVHEVDEVRAGRSSILAERMTLALDRCREIATAGFPEATSPSGDEAQIEIGRRIARHVFSKRGNRAEAHLSELELAAICALAAEHGTRAGLAIVAGRAA
ncbi:MAG TPA: hypothetical protein VN033_08830 [Vulgatibacter sp.]|nr:hypothetical protein [Vulgatibacter sp.]